MPDGNIEDAPRIRNNPKDRKKKLGDPQDRPTIFLAGPVGKGREVQAPDELHGDTDLKPEDLEVNADDVTVTVDEAIEESDLTREEISEKMDIPPEDLDNAYLFFQGIISSLIPESIPGSGFVAEQVVERLLNITDFIDPASLHDDGSFGDDDRDFIDIDYDNDDKGIIGNRVDDIGGGGGGDGRGGDGGDGDGGDGDGGRDSDGDSDGDDDDYDRRRDYIDDDDDDDGGIFSSIIPKAGSKIDLRDSKWWNDDGSFNEKRYKSKVATRIDDTNPLDDLLAGIVTGDPLEGIWDAIMDVVKKAILSSDGVFVHHKGDHPQFGTAMEMQFAYEHDIPVAVYNGGAEDGVMVGKYADAHTDYVTTNPFWAASYLHDTAQAEREPNDAQREDDPYNGYDPDDEYRLPSSKSEDAEGSDPAPTPK